MTLPLVCVLAFALWVVRPIPTAEFASAFATSDFGLWQFVPSIVQSGYYGMGAALAICAVCVYFLAELNNSNVLLRISSRMLSSMLALLCSLVVVTHTLQPGLVLMTLALLAYFTMFATYQLPSPMLTFTTYLLISLSSLVFPKMLLMVPCYWALQFYLRSFSFRCFIASLLGILLPYWFYVCIAFSTSGMPAFVSHVLSLADFHWYDYTQLTASQIVPFAFILLLFVVGLVDFYRNSFLDKTRTRIIYNTVIIHGLYIIIFIGLQPQYLSVLLPMMLVDTSILFGHFFALTYTRFSHILCLVLLALSIGVLLV